MKIEHSSIWITGCTFLLFAALLAGCQSEGQAPLPSPTSEVTRAEQGEFKGMELYSWQDPLGRWQFALLPGTNRLKTEAEIRAGAVDMETLKIELSQLAVGESLFWTHAPFDPQGTRIPPQALVNELDREATAWNLNLVLIGQ